MIINIQETYFHLRTKPSVIERLELPSTQPRPSWQQVLLSNWQLNSFSGLMQTESALQKMLLQLQKTTNSYINQLSRLTGESVDTSEVIACLKKVGTVASRAEYNNLRLNSSQMLATLQKLLQFSLSFEVSSMILEIEKTLSAKPSTKSVPLKETPQILLLKQSCIAQIPAIARLFSERNYSFGREIFDDFAQNNGIKTRQGGLDSDQTFRAIKAHFWKEPTLSKVQEPQKCTLKGLFYDYKTNSHLYFQSLVYKECCTLKGLCNYLTLCKSILLDHYSELTSTTGISREAWKSIYEMSLIIYSRFKEVREQKWMQIDQIIEEKLPNQSQFETFVVEDSANSITSFSLASLNFYLKNLSKSAESELVKLGVCKLMEVFSQEVFDWNLAEDIVEFLENHQEAEQRDSLYAKLFLKVQDCLDQSTCKSRDYALEEVKSGLSYSIESLCKNFQSSVSKVFNQKTIREAIQSIKSSKGCKKEHTCLVGHIFSEFAIHSQESDLQLAKEADSESIYKSLVPELIAALREEQFLMPRQIFELIYAEVAQQQTEEISGSLWQNLAEIHLLRNPQILESFDIEVIEDGNLISEHLIGFLKTIVIHQSKENRELRDSLSTQQSREAKFTEDLGILLEFKSFRDNLVFSNTLLASMTCGSKFSPTHISSLIFELYTPFTRNAAWKSFEGSALEIPLEGDGLISSLCEDKPIEVLKTVYKFLKDQPLAVNFRESISKVPVCFWSRYLSGDAEVRLKSFPELFSSVQEFSDCQLFAVLSQLRQLELALNMLSCVFDKLNEHSQKSIKEIKVMFEWGLKHVENLVPELYPILMGCVISDLVELEGHAQKSAQQSQVIKGYSLFSRGNLSVLDKHLREYFLYETIKRFSKIGQVIQDEKWLTVSCILLHPVTPNLQVTPFSQTKSCIQHPDLHSLYRRLFSAFVLIENSCLASVMGEEEQTKKEFENISNNHFSHQKYFENSLQVLLELRQAVNISQHLVNSSEKGSYVITKKLLEHLKLLLAKIYLPLLTEKLYENVSLQNESSFSISDEVLRHQREKAFHKRTLILEALAESIEIIHRIDSDYEEHILEVMDVLMQKSEQVSTQVDSIKGSKEEQTGNLENDIKDSGKTKSLKERLEEQNGDIILRTLNVFLKCVLQNFKIRSYHLFRLIEAYLKISSKNSQKTISEINRRKFNHVIQGYITAFTQFFLTDLPPNQEIKKLSFIEERTQSKSREMLGEEPLSPVSKNFLNHKKISLSELKQQKKEWEECGSPLRSRDVSEESRRATNAESPISLKSVRKNIKKPLAKISHFQACKQNTTPLQRKQFSATKSLSIQNLGSHSIGIENFIDVSCTLSMFINLFCRLNYGSLSIGVGKIFSETRDKVSYVQYLIRLSEMIVESHTEDTLLISERNNQILNVDVYANLNYAARLTFVGAQEKKACNRQLLNNQGLEAVLIEKVIELVKVTLKMPKAEGSLKSQRKATPQNFPVIETAKSLPIKLLNQRIFTPASSISPSLLKKYLEEFQNEPGAFELAVKSHLLKVQRGVLSSNLHQCNLEAIVGFGSSVLMSTKIMETNKLLLEQELLNRQRDDSDRNLNAKQKFKKFLKKYESAQWKKQRNNVKISTLARTEVNNLIKAFKSAYREVVIFWERKCGDSAEECDVKGYHSLKSGQLYFTFRKLLAVLSRAPEMIPYALSQSACGEGMSSDPQSHTLIDLIVDSLKYSCVLFVQFYVSILKTNPGFCSWTQLQTLLEGCSFYSPTAFKDATLSSKSDELLLHRSQMHHQLRKLSSEYTIPLSMYFEVLVKLKLLAQVLEDRSAHQKGWEMERENTLRSLSFTLKQSSDYRLRSYHFVRVNYRMGEEFLKYFDLGIHEELLKCNIFQIHSQSTSAKWEVLQSCLENLIVSNNSLVEYVKVELDNSLKENFMPLGSSVFVNSSYSLKAFQENNFSPNKFTSAISRENIESQKSTNSLIVRDCGLRTDEKITTQQKKQKQKDLMPCNNFLDCYDNQKEVAKKHNCSKKQSQQRDCLKISLKIPDDFFTEEAEQDQSQESCSEIRTSQKNHLFFPSIYQFEKNDSLQNLSESSSAVRSRDLGRQCQESLSLRECQEMRKYLRVHSSNQSTQANKLSHLIAEAHQLHLQERFEQENSLYNTIQNEYADEEGIMIIGSSSSSDCLNLEAFGFSEDSEGVSEVNRNQEGQIRIDQFVQEDGFIIEEQDSESENENSAPSAINDCIIMSEESFECIDIASEKQQEAQGSSLRNVQIPGSQELKSLRLLSKKQSNDLGTVSQDSVIDSENSSNMISFRAIESIKSLKNGANLSNSSMNNERNMASCENLKVSANQISSLHQGQVDLPQSESSGVQISSLSRQEEEVDDEELESEQGPVGKEDLVALIEDYLMNPESLKLIRKRIRRLQDPQELRRLYEFVVDLNCDPIEQELHLEITKRNLTHLLSRNPPNSPNNVAGSNNSLFSINQLITEGSFYIDENKLYMSNYKKTCKSTQKKWEFQELFDMVPMMGRQEWLQFIRMYCQAVCEQQLQETQAPEMPRSTLLSPKQMINDLFIGLVLQKSNLEHFMKTLVELILARSESDFEQMLSKGAVRSHALNGMETCGVVINDLVSALVANRVGLPIVLKGRYNPQSGELVSSEQQCCLVSNSNLSPPHSQSESILEILLGHCVELIGALELLSTRTYDPSNPTVNRALFPASRKQNFTKTLLEYFSQVRSHSSSQCSIPSSSSMSSLNLGKNSTFPYYNIQDSLKLNKKDQSQELVRRIIEKIKAIPQSHAVKSDQETSHSNASWSLKPYIEIFSIINYLDFETFSDFLAMLLSDCQTEFQATIDKYLDLIEEVENITSKLKLNKSGKKIEVFSTLRSQMGAEKREIYVENIANLITEFACEVFPTFKESCFSFGFGKEEQKKKNRISSLRKQLSQNGKSLIKRDSEEPLTFQKRKQIEKEIYESQKEFALWKRSQMNNILREDILPVIHSLLSPFLGCFYKWEQMVHEVTELFAPGTEKYEKACIILPIGQFYKAFLALEILMEEEDLNLHSMSNLKTKPSIESSKDMLSGRRRSSAKIPRVSLASQSSLLLSHQINPQKSIRESFKKLVPKFSFFSDLVPETYPLLRVHSKYSLIASRLKLLHQKNKTQKQLTIECQRQTIWEDTVRFMRKAKDEKGESVDFAESAIKIKIGQEIGLDYGGVRREWLTLIVRELVNPNFGLFELSVNGLSFQPSKHSHLVPRHLSHFYFFGVLVGKALKEDWLVEVNFTRSFLKHMLGCTLYVEDLEDIDPETTKSLLWILNNEVDEDLGIDFTCEEKAPLGSDSLHKTAIVELVENGKDVLVNDGNKKEYVKKLAQHKMTEQIRDQSKSFMSGVEKVVPFDTLKLFTYKEFGIYLAGMPSVDDLQMKAHARYDSGFCEDMQAVQWFWEVLRDFTEEEKANFLFFLSGSYKVPYGGFEQHPVTINRLPGNCKDYLPVAHTCFSVIDLAGEYSSKERLRTLLEKSICEGKGFSVS